ncbi:GNAT family N-acetyltransferase [Lactobacillus sp. Sy-1]|uniref:GNAT family N-acetyltransferase n=1 Tax=Lactobacillus sp. Sy-1 TaxID=2109645 RepID=UPI001C5860AA|nr:GNAT family protein [Lactobacillus sp. Sy-1]MBW1604958.1 GNAT family N-acetyltransferase [Lactobacillus sp. Sy-1]
MMNLCTFNLNEAEVKLVMPEERFAESIYRLIDQDRESLARFLPWANAINSPEDELHFIQSARQQFVDYKLLLFVITYNDEPVGMIDLHKIDFDNRSAEVGYWLASHVQGQGIMTNALKQMIINIQPELQLHKITVLADVDNLASRSIPQRLGFTHEAVLRDAIFSNGQYHDADTYIRLFNN